MPGVAEAVSKALSPSVFSEVFLPAAGREVRVEGCKGKEGWGMRVEGQKDT